nr:hypothetical protein [Tanacetum cinerariifolium]
MVAGIKVEEEIIRDLERLGIKLIIALLVQMVLVCMEKVEEGRGPGTKDRPPMLAPGIDNDIYSTVDACPNACEMWKAIERLKQDSVTFSLPLSFALMIGLLIRCEDPIVIPLGRLVYGVTTLAVSPRKYDLPGRFPRDLSCFGTLFVVRTMNTKDRPPMLAPGIDNDIYSTVDACPNACEMWKAIERLKQGESINVQDLETNLYWEFGKFTS